MNSMSCPLCTAVAAADSRTKRPAEPEVRQSGSVRRRCPLQAVAAISASLSYAVMGSFVSWTSPMLPKLMSADSDLPLTASEASWVASVPLMTGAAGFLLVPLFFDAVGRRTLLLVGAAPCVAGLLCQAWARTPWELLGARVLYSQGFGFVVPVLPAYIAEVSSDAHRGAAVSAYQVSNCLGSLLVLCIGPYLSHWTVALVLITLPTLFVCTFFWMPESPYYLLIKGRKEAAVSSLRRLRGHDDVSSELAQMETTLAQQRASLPPGGRLASLRQLVTHRAELRTLLLAMGFTVLSMGTGIGAVMGYTSDIMARAGSPLGADLSAVLLIAIQLVASCGVSAVVDTLGRRLLALISFASCALAHTTMGGYFYFQEVQGYNVSTAGWLPFAAIVVYMVGFTMGVGTLVWTISAEMFSSSVKGASMSAVAVTYAVSIFGVTKMYQVVVDSLGVYVLFWIFASSGVLGFWFVYLLIPETKRKSLLDINAELSAKLGA